MYLYDDERGFFVLNHAIKFPNVMRIYTKHRRKRVWILASDFVLNSFVAWGMCQGFPQLMSWKQDCLLKKRTIKALPCRGVGVWPLKNLARQVYWLHSCAHPFKTEIRIPCLMTWRVSYPTWLGSLTNATVGCQLKLSRVMERCEK